MNKKRKLEITKSDMRTKKLYSSRFKKYVSGIQFRLIAIFSIFFCLMIFSLSFTIIKNADSNAQNRIQESLVNLTNQQTYSFDLFLSSLMDTAIITAQDQNLSFILDDHFDDPFYRVHRNFYQKATSIIRNKHAIQLFVLVPDQDRIISNSSTHNATHAGQYYPVWVNEIRENYDQYFFYVDQFPNIKLLRDPLAFSIVIPTNRFSTVYSPVDSYVMVTAGINALDLIFRSNDLEIIDFCVIEDDQGDIIYSTHDHYNNIELAAALPVAFETLKTDSISFDNQPYLVFQNESNHNGWTFRYFVNEEFILGVDSDLRQVIVISSIIIVLIGIGLIYLAALSITKPVYQLKRAVQQITQDDYNIKIDYNRSDEIGDLGKHISIMAQRIDYLIKEIYQSELLRRNAELYALQQQINPHFLYNTLENINALANQKENTKIKQTVHKMASLFRYAVENHPDSPSTIRQEIKHARDYLFIQQLRFPDKVDASFEIDIEIYDCLIPKFVIQPMIENAIQHNINLMHAEKLSIKITGKKDDGNIQLIVKDNGNGIAPEKLQEIYTAFDNRKSAEQHVIHGDENASIGLLNVHLRLKMLFLSPYGLKLRSAIGKGTEVIISIPVQYKGE